MLQLLQVSLYKLKRVQSDCSRCNLYKKSAQVATCTKSQLVHNIYINDLALTLKAKNIGVNIDGHKICIFLYADDIDDMI